jgi:TrmH family RNA methyltransferase
VRAHDQRVVSVDISSPANERIKAAVRLRDRGERDATGLTIIDGTREIERALDANVPFDHAFVCAPLLDATGEGLARKLRDADVPMWMTSEVAYRRIAFGERSDGIVAVIRAPRRSLADVVLRDDPLVVVLEGVEKPGNVGAVLRSADGAGTDAVIAADSRTDFFNPNAIRASIGTVFSTQTAAATSAQVSSFLRERNIRAVAARPDADLIYADADLTGGLAIVLGNEAEGLTATWRAPDIIAVRLPMLGVADSLNVSVTAAVLLYEAVRQRRS